MLHFPDYGEIPLENPPIKEVVCQVRFPPILRIAKDQPIEFQEQVRSQFPNLEFGQEILVQLSPFSTSPTPTASGPRLYHFKTLDDAYVATLAPNFFALSTKIYSHWSDFLSHLSFLASVAISVYDIHVATRIGLRYINQFTPENTGVQDISQLWEFLRRELRGYWRTDAWDDPVETLSQLILPNENQEHLAMRFGYLSKEDTNCLLDLDYFVEGHLDLTERSLLSYCERSHRIIYSAFRWAVPVEKLVVFGTPSDTNKDVA